MRYHCKMCKAKGDLDIWVNVLAEKIHDEKWHGED